MNKNTGRFLCGGGKFNHQTAKFNSSQLYTAIYNVLQEREVTVLGVFDDPDVAKYVTNSQNRYSVHVFVNILCKHVSKYSCLCTFHPYFILPG